MSSERSIRVAYLISGAGGMYCGSCLRDNRLAATLIDRGHDVTLIPLYTPIRTDEKDVSGRPVYYGGINTYLQHKSALFRRTPRFLDNLLDTPALLRIVGRWAGSTRAESLGPLTVSVLKGEHGPQHKELQKLIAGLKTLNPSVITLPNLMFVGVAAALKSALRVPVICTLAGEDIFLDALPDPYRRQAFKCIHEGAAAVDMFIAPTNYYATHAATHFNLPKERIRYVPMGVNVDHFADSPQPPAEPFTIGYLARLCPEKGLAVLCKSFARLRETGRDCRLRIAGYLGGADVAYFRKTRNYLDDCGLADAVDYVGEVDLAGKVAFLRSVHMLSVPTVYHEAKGLYILEALAAGRPVVQPRHGAFPELIEATNGGLLYDPDDPADIDKKIVQLMEDRETCEKLGREGRRVVGESFTSKVMADHMWSVYQEVCSR